MDGKPVSKLKQYTIRDAIFEAIIDKYYEDPTLVSYGEDVREWGGAFGVYQGLSDSIPFNRLFNSPSPSPASWPAPLVTACAAAAASPS